VAAPQAICYFTWQCTNLGNIFTFTLIASMAIQFTYMFKLTRVVRYYKYKFH